MSSDFDIAAQRQLSELAELSLEVARDLAAAMKDASSRDMVRLAGAFAQVSRCMRMCIALASRLARGETLAPAHRASAQRDDDELEPDDWDDLDDEERPEGLERESLFDRLPPGDPATQVASIATILTNATRGLPAASAYRARCDAVVAGLRRERPRRPPDRAPPTPPDTLGLAVAPNRSRGSPG